MWIDMNVVSYIIFGVFLFSIMFPFLYKENLYRQINGVNTILGRWYMHTGDIQERPAKLDNGIVVPPKGHNLNYADFGGYVVHRSRINFARWPNKPFLFNWLSIKVPCCEWDEGNAEPIAHHRLPDEDAPERIIGNKFMQGLADTAEVVAKARAAEAVKEQAAEFARTMTELTKRRDGNKIGLILSIITVLGLLVLGVIMYMKFGALGL